MTNTFTAQAPYTKNHKAEYDALANAKHRCTQEKNRCYKDYGARGIKVCDEWMDGKDGFKSFFAHIGPRPSEKHTLDRLDNELGYQPGNVAWRTYREQLMNRRISYTPEQYEEFEAAAKMTGATYRTIMWRHNEGMNIWKPVSKAHSAKSNARDSIGRGYLTSADIDQNEVAANLAKLPPARIPTRRLRNDAIRARFANETVTVGELANEYKLRPTSILNILRGRA